jgi:hypothetical protein
LERWNEKDMITESGKFLYNHHLKFKYKIAFTNPLLFIITRHAIL